MKKFLLPSMIAFFSMPVFAFAHGDKIEMTKASLAEALKNFSFDHADQIKDFQGTKTWFDGDTAKIRVYLPNNVSMVYSCKHQVDGNGGEVVRCQMEM